MGMSGNYIRKSDSVKRAPLANEVANKIIEMISEEGLKPGERIPVEAELIDRFEVGRGTIREAVKLLVSRRVLEIRPAKGTFICENPGVTDDPLGLNFVSDKMGVFMGLLELRDVLERYAVRKAALNATEEQIGQLRWLVDQIEQSIRSQDNEKCVEYDIQFHEYIAKCSGNLAIPIVLPVINSNIQNFNNMKFVRRWDVVNRGHFAIVDAIAARDPELAEEDMINHLAYVTEKIKSMPVTELMS